MGPNGGVAAAAAAGINNFIFVLFNLHIGIKKIKIYSGNQLTL
jgi:hypothetical protein